MKLSPHDSSLDALKFVVDMADVPMVITDEDGRFVFANGHTLDIVGKAEDACIGKPLASLLSVSRRPRFNRSGKAPRWKSTRLNSSHPSRSRMPSSASG